MLHIVTRYVKKEENVSYKHKKKQRNRLMDMQMLELADKFFKQLSSHFKDSKEKLCAVSEYLGNARR